MTEARFVVCANKRYLGLLPSLIARALAGLVLDNVFVELLGQPLRARLLLPRLQARHSEPTRRASPLGLYKLAVIDSLLKVFLDPGRVGLDVDAPLLGHEALDGGRSAAFPWVVPQRLDGRLHHLRHWRNLSVAKIKTVLIVERERCVGLEGILPLALVLWKLLHVLWPALQPF